MTDFSQVISIVLAGGKGKRMNSDMPKVMHQLAGKPIIRHLIDTLSEMGLSRVVVVVGHGREKVITACRNNGISFAIQEKQLGTADAVKAAASYLRDFDGDILVLNGDVPLLRRESIEHLASEHQRMKVTATVLTSIPDDPTGYGRIIKDTSGYIKKIVEHADANDEELQVREINTGIYVFDARSLLSALDKVDCDNVQGEYYLTDVVKTLLPEDKKTGAVLLDDYREALGINSREQLKELEELYPVIKNVDKGLDRQ